MTRFPGEFMTRPEEGNAGSLLSPTRSAIDYPHCTKP